MDNHTVKYRKDILNPLELILKDSRCLILSLSKIPKYLFRGKLFNQRKMQRTNLLDL